MCASSLKWINCPLGGGSRPCRIRSCLAGEGLAVDADETRREFLVTRDVLLERDGDGMYM